VRLLVRPARRWHTFQIAADLIPRLQAAHTGRANLENEMPITPPRAKTINVSAFFGLSVVRLSRH
jgi:hypothetical protein